MSTGQISKAKKELLERKLITIETNELPNGWRKGHAVRVVDVWPTNLYYYTEYRKAKKNMSEAS